LRAGESVNHKLKPGRHAWLHVLRGGVQLNETAFTAGDGAAVSDEAELIIRGTQSGEVMPFDLP
jgi:redox-sensitive bicupin YhaK (pirin superfamily)